MKKAEKFAILISFMEDRTGVLEFYRDMYYALPTQELLDKIVTFEDMGDIEGLEMWEQKLVALANYVKNSKESDLLGELRAEFTRLFIGPKSPPASLFESVYLSPRRHLFDKVTTEVRAFYAKHGLEVERKDRIPDDHIAYEIEFLYYLSNQATALVAKNKTIREVKEVLTASNEFCETHLMKWVGKFKDRVEKNSKFEFFTLIAQSMVLFLESDIELVKGIIETL